MCVVELAKLTSAKLVKCAAHLAKWGTYHRFSVILPELISAELGLAGLSNT